MNDYVKVNSQTAGWQGIANVNEVPPATPTPSQKARETMEYLREAELVMGDIRRRIYGPFPENGNIEAKRADEPCLDELLTGICQRAACLAGELKSILGRL